MPTVEYKPMRCKKFKRDLELLSLGYKNPKEERRMKIHAIFCSNCRKVLEAKGTEDNSFAPTRMLQDIRHEETAKDDVIVNLGKDYPDLHSKQLMLEPMLFRDDEESPPNSEPMFTGALPLRAPVTAQTRLTRDRCEDPRHAHFEQTLDVDGDN